MIGFDITVGLFIGRDVLKRFNSLMNHESTIEEIIAPSSTKILKIVCFYESLFFIYFFIIYIVQLS